MKNSSDIKCIGASNACHSSRVCMSVPYTYRYLVSAARGKRIVVVYAYFVLLHIKTGTLLATYYQCIRTTSKQLRQVKQNRHAPYSLLYAFSKEMKSS